MDLTRETTFFEGWSWFKFNNLGLALGASLKFYTSVAKGLKLKVRKFCGLIPTFVEVTGEKLAGGGNFLALPILNRVKGFAKYASYLALRFSKLGTTFKKYLLHSAHTTSLQRHKTSIRQQDVV